MIEVGQVWKHSSICDDIVSVWEVVEKKVASPHLKLAEGTFLPRVDQNVYLKLLSTTNNSDDAAKVGDYLVYWLFSMKSNNGWTQVDLEDLPLIILGTV